MADKTPTPHIGAKYGEIAPTVIMAGDPLRAKLMAERYLENPTLYNQVRGMLGYTGTYKGKRISLFNFYDVKTIIRVGSAGSMNPDLHIGDLVMAMGACTNSAYAMQFHLPGIYAPIADFDLLRAAVEKTEELGYRYKVGNVYSSDTFYDDSPDTDQWQKMGVLAVEMEAPALYMNAARSGARALCICTISDSLVTGEVTTAEERQNNFTQMMDVAFGIISYGNAIKNHRAV